MRGRQLVIGKMDKWPDPPIISVTYPQYNCGTIHHTSHESGPDGCTVHEVDISKLTDLIVVRILSPSHVTVGLNLHLQTSDAVRVQNMAGQINISFLVNFGYRFHISRAKYS